MSQEQPKRLSVVILNYRTPELVIDCLQSLISQLDRTRDAVTVVDNASNDGSAEQIQEFIANNQIGDYCRIINASTNGGFSAGNNIGVEAQLAGIYYLLNSDTLLRDGSIAALFRHFDSNPDDDLVGPRLEWPDGDQQVSRFRVTTPLTEFVRAAAIGALDRVFARHVNAISHSDRSHPGWLSFAAVAIRAEAWERIGKMDDGFFMYYEDVDYGRRATKAGCRLGFCESARVVHLQGGSITKMQDSTDIRRLPPYYYASRSRYFAKYYGPLGPVIANILWTLGWLISIFRRSVLPGGRRHPTLQWRDIWYGAWSKSQREQVRFVWP